MEFSEIIRVVLIVGLILVALPFPIALAAVAAASAIAVYFAIETLVGVAKSQRASRTGRPHPSGGAPPP